MNKDACYIYFCDCHFMISNARLDFLSFLELEIPRKFRRRGGFRIFSKGDTLSKKKANFVDFFVCFQVDQIFSRALLKDPALALTFAPESSFWKKQAKKGVFRHFLAQTSPKNCVLLARAPPQDSKVWHQSALEKTFGSAS